MLDDEQLLRYSRQILLPQIDVAGQETLRRAHVLMVGAGGLGSAAALYLAGAGVGRLTIVDDDCVEGSNLQRQVAYRQADLGKRKSEALADQLVHLNPDVAVTAVTERAGAAWLAENLAGVSVVLDCSDNFATRSAVNAACFAARIPLVSGAAIRLEGQLVSLDFRAGSGPCYQCLYGDGDDHDTLCSETGILGPVVGMIGTAQALEAIKLLAGLPVSPQLHLFDGQYFQWRALSMKADPACCVCGAT